ncbi:MAG: Rrf2 family transcriptional regulator [Gemmatimonadaceae bacterium]|nr:Rrf2 family transcriptional regulator [Gemmatimonadaceae bacterium]
MWISGTSQYAIRAVVHVAAHGADAPVRVGPIAEALDMPRNYLSKTLHALARAGVLKSERGPRGGFQLAKPAARLTLAQVTAPFEDVETRHCLLGRPHCGGANACAAHARWNAVSTSLQTYFASTTIADLLDDTRAARTPSSARARPRAASRRATTRRR